jgi:AcrR family transcriptional regulator
MARPKVHTEELRTELLRRAGELVRDEGVGALSLRALAADVGTSTTAVYTLFGGKDGLIEALLEAAFSDFAAHQNAVPVTDDPVADVAMLGRAYLEWALARPDLYAVLFGGSLVASCAVPDLPAAAESQAPIHHAVERAVVQGRFEGASVEVIAQSLKAQVHGLAHMANLGMFEPDLDALLVCAVATIRGWEV